MDVPLAINDIGVRSGFKGCYFLLSNHKFRRRYETDTIFVSSFRDYVLMQ